MDTLLRSRERNGTLKTKNISFLDDVISCPSVSFAIQQGVSVPSDCLAASSPFPWGHKALPNDYLHCWRLKTHLLF